MNRRVTAPTLIIEGEEDWPTLIGEGEQGCLALKKLDATTELVRYPRPSHVTHPDQLPKRRADNPAR